MARRRLLAGAGLAALAALPGFGGCGFALRQAPSLPFTRIALLGFAPRSPLEAELRQRLADSALVMPTPDQAQVVLQVLQDKREKSVVASTSASQIRELRLRLLFEFRLTTPGGQVLVPATELLLSRDMSYSETVALAKAQEEGELYAAMQSDVVEQLLRRLARAPVPG